MQNIVPCAAMHLIKVQNSSLITIVCLQYVLLIFTFMCLSLYSSFKHLFFQNILQALYLSFLSNHKEN